MIKERQDEEVSLAGQFSRVFDISHCIFSTVDGNYNYDIHIITATMDDFISYKMVSDHGNVIGEDFALNPLKKELAEKEKEETAIILQICYIYLKRTNRNH
jgi:hypothetical protein